MAATDNTTLDAEKLPDVSARTRRALEQYLTVLGDYGRADGDDLFVVVSESGSEYLVDLRLEACECEDHQYREARCKHIRRAAFATGREPIPVCAAEQLDVDEQLGIHVDGDLRFAAADGGVVDAGDGDDGDDGDGDSEACDVCGEVHDTIDCFEPVGDYGGED